MAAASFLSRLAAPAKVGLTVGVVALIGAGYYFVFHGDVEHELVTAQQSGIRLTDELNKVRAAEQAYQKDLAELAEREQREKELNQILPASTEYPQFLSAVQAAANDSGVSLSAWTPREKVPEKYYARVPMKLELTGRFLQIARFFHSVGQLDRIINMENIQIQNPKGQGDDIVLTVSCLATAFHLLEAKTTDGTEKKGKGRKRR